MSWISTGTASTGSGGFAFNLSHALGGSYDGHRSVITVVTQDTITISSINVFPDGTPGGWTLRSSVSAQGRTWWLYDKICGPTEPQFYRVTFSGTVTTTTVGYLTDFATGGDAVRAVGHADAVSSPTLTLPSLTAARADDIFAAVWDETSGGNHLSPDPPLTFVAVTTSPPHNVETSRESWQSSSPTGTRTYTMSSGNYGNAFGVMFLVGDYDPGAVEAGGWGVGGVRMGANA